MIIIKTNEQIQKLREIGRKHAKIFKMLSPMLIPGTSTAEIDAVIKEQICIDGDQPAFLNYHPDWAPHPYPASSCISVNDMIVHGIPSAEEKLSAGDIVSIDFGIRRDDVCTDAAQEFLIGDVSNEVRELSNTTRAALDAGIKAARAGNTVGDIGAAIQAINAGKYGLVHELAGHGVGINLHEDPLVPNFGKAGECETLRPGMVLAIEPMFTLGGISDVEFDEDGYSVMTRDGLPASHWEQNILITNGAPEILISE